MIFPKCWTQPSHISLFSIIFLRRKYLFLGWIEAVEHLYTKKRINKKFNKFIKEYAQIDNYKY